jgi:hypothetical protein
MDVPPDRPNGVRRPGGPPPDWEARRRTMRNLWTIRWIIMGLSALLAVALIVSGAVFLGLLLLAIVGVRLTMMMMLQRRRREFRQRRNWPDAGPESN